VSCDSHISCVYLARTVGSVLFDDAAFANCHGLAAIRNGLEVVAVSHATEGDKKAIGTSKVTRKWL